MGTPYRNGKKETISLARRANDDRVKRHRLFSSLDQVEEPVLVFLESAPVIQLALKFVRLDFARGDLLEHLLDFLTGANGYTAMAHTEHAPRTKLLDIGTERAIGHLVNKFQERDIPQVVLAFNDGRQRVALLIDFGIELFNNSLSAVGDDIEVAGLIFIGIEKAGHIGAVCIEQHLEIAAGVRAEAFEVGEVIRRDDFRPLGDDPPLPDNGFVGAGSKLGVDRVGNDVVVKVSHAERGQVLPGIPEYLGIAGGAFNPLVIDIHCL
jgi:hypothetical protein